MTHQEKDGNNTTRRSLLKATAMAAGGMFGLSQFSSVGTAQTIRQTFGSDTGGDGVINPYAVAELVLDRNIDWERVDADETFESIFRVPSEQLYDPKFGSPLYQPTVTTQSLRQSTNSQFVQANPGRQSTNFQIVQADPGIWKKMGSFYQSGASGLDPVQGNVANCYLIAALGSIAWARPNLLLTRPRDPPSDPSGFESADEPPASIRFYDINPTDGVNMAGTVDVSENLMVNQNDRILFATSTQARETWPGVYEKAYAKWIARVTTDTPPIRTTAIGSGVGALSQLTGWPRYHYRTRDSTATDLWNLLTHNSPSGRTVYPMVAATYHSEDDLNGTFESYASRRLVARHVYSVLGYSEQNNTRYIVLRNPWGHREPTVDVIKGIWTTRGTGQRAFSINLEPNDGVFALDFGIFQRYFRYLGGILPPVT